MKMAQSSSAVTWLHQRGSLRRKRTAKKSGPCRKRPATVMLKMSSARISASATARDARKKKMPGTQYADLPTPRQMTMISAPAKMPAIAPLLLSVLRRGRVELTRADRSS